MSRKGFKQISIIHNVRRAISAYLNKDRNISLHCHQAGDAEIISKLKKSEIAFYDEDSEELLAILDLRKL